MKKNEILNRKLTRSVDVKGIKLDSETRTIEFPFSSELPVNRWFGKEVLSHKTEAVDLSRFNDGAQVLFNHNWDRYIGVIERAWIDGRGFVKIRFSKNEDAEKVMRDVEDEILRNVSFGYEITDMVLSRQGEDGENEYTATRWVPYEVSIVTVPADPSVGIGRSLEGRDDEKFVALIENARSKYEAGVKAEIEKLSKKENEKPAVNTALKTGVKMENQADVKSERADAVRIERERTKAITALCEKYGQKDLARELIDGEKTIEEARAAVLERMGTQQKPITGNEQVIGLNEKEVRQFSFMRAINAMLDPHNKKAQEAAKFEREASDAAAQKAGKSARGLMVPIDILRAALTVDGKRDLVVGTASAGGNLVATNLLAASFIDMLRNRSVLQRAGAMVLNGLQGNIAIPRQTGGATAYWVAESGNPTESQQAFDQVTMSPKTLGAFTDYSRKLLLQSSMDVEMFIRSDLAKVIALEIDRAGLYGSGSSNQPLGLKDTSGINTKDFAANAPTFAEIVELETLVAADNADVGSLAYLMNATGRGSLKTTEKSATSNGQFIWEQGNTVNGYRAEVSNQIAANDFLFGNWSDLIIGMWSGLDILVDPYTGGVAGTVRVIAHQDCDVAVRHAESFARGNNTL